jgi:hypothetical protein
MTSKGKEILKKPIRIRLITIDSASQEARLTEKQAKATTIATSGRPGRGICFQ